VIQGNKILLRGYAYNSFERLCLKKEEHRLVYNDSHPDKYYAAPQNLSYHIAWLVQILLEDGL